MHVIHPHPRRALLAAVAALALAFLALLPATLADVSISIPGGDGSAQSGAPATAPAHPEPAWHENPFAYPLLQAPGAR